MMIRKKTFEEIQNAKPTVAEMRTKKRFPIVVVLENIRSLYNVGAMFRTADAALVSKIYLCGSTGKPPRGEIDKAALGATDVVPWEYCRDCPSVLKKMKSENFLLTALELTHQSISYCKAHYSYPFCLVVGNEVTGISEESLKLCDMAIDIPMLGRANSLNVATAFGISLFEILRQYKNNKND